MIWYLLFIAIDTLECSLHTNSFVTTVMLLWCIDYCEEGFRVCYNIGKVHVTCKTINVYEQNEKQKIFSGISIKIRRFPFAQFMGCKHIE